ncbi:MAG: calcium-binding protein, partial [Bosea sp. (in: a-proteobacteria)]
MPITYTPGPETLVNTTTASNQYNSVTTKLTGGGYVVTWISTGQDGSDLGIYMQRYNAAGTKLGGETLVNTTTADAQIEPTVAALNGGGYVVIWSSNNQDGDGYGVYMQLHDASGTKVGTEALVNTVTALNQSLPSVAALSGGGYVVSWTSINQDGSNAGIFMQRYDAAGTKLGVETLVNTTTAGLQFDPTVIALTGGGYVVSWQSFSQDGGGFGVYMQRYNSSGVAQGTETLVNTTTANDQSRPCAAALADGSFVMIWTSLAQDGSAEGVYMQRYSALGVKLGVETRVNTATTNNQFEPSVSALSDGGYVVTWTSSFQDGSGQGVYMQRYDASGTAQGAETRVNTTIPSDQLQSSVSGLQGGGYVVTWTANNQDGGGFGIYQRLYLAIDQIEVAATTNYTGQSLANKNGIAFTAAATATFAADQFGAGLILNSVAITGEANANTITVNMTAAGMFTAAGWTFSSWTAGSDLVVINGSTGDDEIVGTNQSNSINGDLGNDNLVGGAGADTLNGGGGNDTLNGGGGADYLIGGMGDDLYLLNDASAIIIDQAGEGLDTVNATVSAILYFELENAVLLGTGNIGVLGNDSGNTITGNSGNNGISTLGGNDTVMAGAGDDTLDGGAGADALSGGTGIDTYFVDNVGDVVTEVVENGVYDTVWTTVDFVLGANIDIFIANGAGASNGAGNNDLNLMLGNLAVNVLFGLGGNDVILALAGHDVIDGGADNDTIFGGDGRDTLAGGTGNDLIGYGAISEAGDTITDFTTA